MSASVHAGIHPPGSRPPWTRQTPLLPPGADTNPPEQTPPRPGRPPPGSRLKHTVYEWPVHILLECILVTGVCPQGGHAWLWGACVAAGGHVWLPGGMHGCWGACMVVRGHAFLWGHAWLWGGACVGYDEMRSMSGRYAYFWNAFL